MRIHTNVIGYTQQIRNALRAEKDAGRIAPHVSFKTLSPAGSRSHQFAFEIQLEAEIRDNGRRAGNSGSYGAGENYAATYDEWGWLLAALFEIDPDMIAGSVKFPVYDGREHFDSRTAYSYNPRELVRFLEAGGDPFPYVEGQGAGTKRGYLIGRRGAGRTDRRAPWTVERPRTVADVLEFAHLTPEAE